MPGSLTHLILSYLILSILSIRPQLSIYLPRACNRHRPRSKLQRLLLVQFGASLLTMAETIHSTSLYIQPLENPTAYAKAKFMDFAPASAICYSCCISEGGKKRTYAIMYDSKLEINRPIEPCMCCSTEQCIVDQVSVAYLDKPPFRTGMHSRPLKSGLP
jgi:hypothetical protein